jgi:hypothetical protein
MHVHTRRRTAVPHGLSQRVQAGVSPRFRRVARAGLAASLSLALIATAGSAALADQVRQTEWWLRTLHVTNAWEITRGSGVRIAVLDTGVAPAQAGLTGSVIQGPDYTNSGRTAGGPFWGIHGTEVASLIAGRGYGPARASGIIGIAPAAKILSVRVTLESNDPLLSDQRIAAGLPDAIARGIRWAVRQDAGVIDLPLDPVTTAGAPGSGGSAAERAAVGYALANHVVLVAPAGDGGAGTDPVNYPAAYPGVISVGAFDQQFVKAPFSSRQGYVTVTAAGVGVTAAGPFGTYPQLYSTSAASAIVAGIAALIRAQFPQLTPAQVTRAITSSTVYRRHGGRADGSGYGTVDAAKALVAAAAITEAVPGSAASSTGSGQAAPSPPTVHSGPIHRNIRGTLIEDAIIAGLVFLLLLGIIFGAKAWRRRHARSARLAEVRAAAQIPVRKPGQAKKPSQAQAKAAKAKAGKAKAAKAKAGKAKAGKGAARKAVPAGALVTAGVGAAAGGAAETQEAAEPQLEPAGFIPAPLGPAAGGPGGSGFTGSAAPAFTGSSSGFTGSASGFTGSAAGFSGSAAPSFTRSAAPAFTGSAAPAFTGSSSGFTGSASGFTRSAAPGFTGSAATGFTGSASGFTGSAAPGFTESASPGVAAGDPSSPGVAAGGASSQGFTADSPSSPGFTAAGPSFPGLGPAGASSPVVPGSAPPPTAPAAPPAEVVPPADLTPPAGPGTGTPPWARMQSDPRGLPREGAAEAIPGGASPGGASPGGASPGGASPGSAFPGGASPGGASPGSAFPGGASPGGAFVSAASPAPTGAAGGAPDSGAGTAGDGVGLGRIGTRLTQGPRQPRTPQVSGRPPWEPAPEPDGELPWAQAPMPPRSGAESLPRRAQARPELPSWDELAQSVWPGGPKAAGPHPPVSSPADPKARPAGLAATGRAVPAAGLVPPTSSPGAAAAPPEGSAASATDAAAASQPGVFPARRPSLALPRRIGGSLARQASGGRDAGPASEGPAGAGPTGASSPDAGPTGTGPGGAGWAGTGTSQPPFPPAPRPPTDHGPPNAGQPERGPFPRAIKPPTDPWARGAGTAGAGASGAGRDGPGAPWAGRPAAGSGPAHASQPEPGTTATSAAPAAAKPAAESPQAGVPPWAITDSLPAVPPAKASGATQSTGPAGGIESFPAVDPRAERRSFPEANLGDSTESFPAVRPHADMEDAFRLFPSAHGPDKPPAADDED